MATPRPKPRAPWKRVQVRTTNDRCRSARCKSTVILVVLKNRRGTVTTVVVCPYCDDIPPVLAECVD